MCVRSSIAAYYLLPEQQCLDQIISLVLIRKTFGVTSVLARITFFCFFLKNVIFLNGYIQKIHPDFSKKIRFLNHPDIGFIKNSSADINFVTPQGRFWEASSYPCRGGSEKFSPKIKRISCKNSPETWGDEAESVYICLLRSWVHGKRN